MITLHSPAKINLFLRILRRRPDHFHELASLFQTIDFHDTLQFALSNSDQLTCTDLKIPTDQSNLIWQATDLFRRKTGLNFSVKIELEKRIPPMAGLGGGSGNAATTLWALNHLTGTPATPQELTQWASEIGSDVSFFLSEGTAYCTGRGEIIKPLPPLPAQKLWIIKPEEGLSTPAVYKALRLDSVSLRDPEQILKGFLKGHPNYFNDLELPAFSLMPALAELKESLLTQGFEHVLMSGSGSSVFAIGNIEPIRKRGFSYYPARFINRSSEQWYTIKT